MEPLFELIGAWWWLAPSAVGLGAVGYGLITRRRRRARRLAVDAARHEVALAQAAIVAARADVRAAHARLLSVQARSGAPDHGIRSSFEARQQLRNAKRARRGAIVALRAKKDAVRAARAQLHAAPRGAGDAALPLAALMAEQDAVTARWLEYETDVAKLIAFPQMTDARHPSTAAFLVARRDAQALRPPSAQARVAPHGYVAYRDAVTRLEDAFATAERDARRAGSAPSRPAAPPAQESPRSDAAPRVWPVPARGSRPPASE